MKYTGKCLCGEVTYTADAPPVVVAQCHCEECRRLSGTGHTVGAMFVSRVVTVNGKLSEFSYSSDNGSEVTRVFCANCGSPIYGKNTRTPDHLTNPSIPSFFPSPQPLQTNSNSFWNCAYRSSVILNLLFQTLNLDSSPYSAAVIGPNVECHWELTR